MGFGNSFIGKILVTAIGGVVASILGMIIILGLIYLIAKFGIVPYVQSHVNIPQWMIELIDKLL